MNGKKILTVQDLSCVGQCSLTVALPVLSHYGLEVAVLPTAVLSNHTMFKSWSYLDLTDEIPSIGQVCVIRGGCVCRLNRSFNQVYLFVHGNINFVWQ